MVRLNFINFLKNNYFLYKEDMGCTEKFNPQLLEYNTSSIDYKVFVDSSLDVVWKMNLQSCFTYVNPSIYNQLGFTVEEWTGSKLSDHVTPKEFNRIARIALCEIKRSEKSKSVYFETVILNRAGKPIDFEIVFKFVCDENGIPKEIIGSARNISERIKCQLERKRYNAIRDKFFSVVAHDLKGSFSSLLGFSDLLVDMVKDQNDEKLKKFTKLLNNNLQNTYDYLNNLLEWTMAQTNGIDVNLQNFRFINLVNDVFDIVKLQAKMKTITLTYKIDEQLDLLADSKMIETVLLNLLSNAIKYSNNGGKISVSAEQNEKEFKCSVRDNGIGISEDRIKSIFIFEENSSTLGTNNETGTGLGLILSKEFIERHKGKIGVSSKLGKGTTFWFTIPV